MLTTLYYCFQVILCSTIMMGYYWLVLRDKKFHQYNRFYLMAIAVLSWIVPLIKIQWQQAVEADSTMYYLLSSVASNNTDIDLSLQSKWYNLNWQALLTVTYISVSLILLTGMVSALVRIYRLLKNNSCKSLGEVFVVLTNANGTPFSFFNYIFWNDAIDLKSESGKQILQHELTHVKQKHSIDKILIQLVLIVGWFNPFFWLIKKEMDMIHEFIADQHTIENGDAASLAEMLLTAVYPKQKYLLANPFFFSPIKRRIQMMKNNSNPKYSYMRRLIILPLLAIVVVLFAFRNKENAKPISVGTIIENIFDKVKTTIKDTTILNSDSVYIIPTDKKITIISPNGTTSFSSNGKADFSKEKNTKFGLTGSVNAVYYLDGKKVDKSVLNDMNPNAIKSVEVLKGASAIAIYGDEGRDGVINITSKPIVNVKLEDIKPEPHYYLDGNLIDPIKFHTINPDIIESMLVLKDTNAIKIYGEKGRNGVVNLITKKEYRPEGGTISIEGSAPLKIVKGYKIDEVNNLEPLVLVDGKVIEGGIKSIDVNSIQSVTILKGDDVFKKYGDVVKKGVIEVTTKNHYVQNKVDSSIVGGPITVIGYKLEPNKNKSNNSIVDKIKASNSSIKNVYFYEESRRLNIQFKDGTEEVYNLENTSSRAKAEKKYGIKLVPPPPPAKMKVVEGKPLIKEEQYDKVFTIAQVPAEFPGGKDAWQKYLQRNLNRDIPVEKGAPAGKYTVIIDFIVKDDGTIVNPKMANNPGYGTAEEALRMISRGPKWMPALQNGKPVTSRVKQSVTFQVSED